MEFMLSSLMLIIAIGLFVNHRHSKNNEEYSEYLEELRKIKDRKLQRSSNIGGRWKRADKDTEDVQ